MSLQPASTVLQTQLKRSIKKPGHNSKNGEVTVIKDCLLIYTFMLIIMYF